MGLSTNPWWLPRIIFFHSRTPLISLHPIKSLELPVPGPIGYGYNQTGSRHPNPYPRVRRNSWEFLFLVCLRVSRPVWLCDVTIKWIKMDHVIDPLLFRIILRSKKNEAFWSFEGKLSEGESHVILNSLEAYHNSFSAYKGFKIMPVTYKVLIITPVVPDPWTQKLTRASRTVSIGQTLISVHSKNWRLLNGASCDTSLWSNRHPITTDKCCHPTQCCYWSISSCSIVGTTAL